MKALPALALLICLPCSAQIKQRDWTPATVAEITTHDDEIVKPVSEVRIPTTVTIYRFETAEITYLVRNVTRRNGKPLNVTLHGRTQVAADRMSLHVLDDAGKDVKLPIVEKIAK